LARKTSWLGQKRKFGFAGFLSDFDSITLSRRNDEKRRKKSYIVVITRSYTIKIIGPTSLLKRLEAQKRFGMLLEFH
jgi:hypothetical protein